MIKKEFFSVLLPEIEQFISENGFGEIEFTKIAEAKEHRETLAIREKLIEDKEKQDFPDKLF